MARPKLGESESKRLQMVITEDELTAIDNWRFPNRIGTRSEAIRRLCQIGIGLEPLVHDLKQLGENVEQAQIDIRLVLTDAIVKIDTRENGDTLQIKEDLEEIRRALNKLVPASMELSLQAAAMADVLSSLTSGRSLEGSIEDMKRRIREKEGSRQFVRKTFGAKK